MQMKAKAADTSQIVNKMAGWLLWTVVVLMGGTSFATVLINEIQSANDSTCTDESGEAPDWIELYNNGDQSVDLSGWGLSDNTGKPFKWTFPSGTVMGPHGYLRVFADSSEAISNEVVVSMSPDDPEVKDELVAWFRADDALTTYGDNGRVVSWKDCSERGNNATNVTVSQQPIVKADILNGHAALSFSSSSKQQLFLPRKNFNGMDSFSNATVMVVGMWNGIVPRTNRSGILGLSLTNSNYDVYFEVQPNGVLRVRNGLSSNDMKISAGIKPDAWYGMSFTTDSEREVPLTQLYLNSGLIGSMANPIGAQSLSAYEGSFSIGNTYRSEFGNGQNCAYNGMIAEMIIFRKALTADEFKSVFKYLSVKYGLAETANLHAGFSLSADGETVVLTDAGTGEIEDSVTFGAIPCDRSYGRSVADPGRFAYFAEPSPNAPNAEAEYSGPMAPVAFSVQRGVFDKPISLVLSHPDPETRIYYTIDHSDPSETNGILYDGEISIEHTTVVRATAVKDGALPYRNIATHTYLYLDDVVSQVRPEMAPEQWTDSGSCAASYGISQSVITDEVTRAEFKNALASVPILSLTMSDTDMFDPDSGLYCKPSKLNGVERAASAEWLTGDVLVAQDAGLRVQGNMSRSFDKTPKKSFRLSFRSRYGANSLDAPVLCDAGCKNTGFKTLVLRAEHNYSWPASEDGSKGTYYQDQLVRDLQQRVSGYQTCGSHVQLFINGLYWGFYNITERPDDATSAAIWGGEKDDWDVIKNRGAEYEVRDGSSISYKELFACAKRDLSNPDNYDKVTQRLSIRDFADYMIIETFIANMDWPNNNWVAMANVKMGEPFRYAVWDSEIACFDPNSNRLNLNTTGYSPYALHNLLKVSPEYRLAMADRAHKHLFNDGALCAAVTTNVLEKLSERVRPALFAESARWGAFKHDFIKSSYPIYGLKQWNTTIQNNKSFWINRPGRYLAQLKAEGLYPQTGAPEFLRTGEDGKSATLSGPEGCVVYYTTDGTDPRVPFAGTVNTAAIAYVADEEISVRERSVVYARALSADNEWSALSEIELEGSSPAVLKNEFLSSKNGVNWDKAENWSLGYYPNGAGEWAVIGVPTDFKKDKGWRNIHINKHDVMVGHVEITSGGCTNRIDTGSSGNLILKGEPAEDGVANEAATIVVLDRDDASLAMIDLDAPNVLRLDSDAVFTVSNEVGDVEYGGLYVRGVLAGCGHNLKKEGPGRLTIDFTNAVDYASLDKLQCEEGVVAIQRKIHVGSITKNGPVYLKTGGSDLEAAVANATICDTKLSADDVRLFVPTTIGGTTYYGGVVAGTSVSAAKKCKAYVLDDEGDIHFCGKTWSLCSSAKISVKTLDSGAVTYQIEVPNLRGEGSLVPATGLDSAVLVAETEQDAIANVKLVPPETDEGKSSVDEAIYRSYFKITALPTGEDGAYMVCAELDSEKVDADDSLQGVAESLSAIPTSAYENGFLRTSIPTCAGLYYSVLSTVDIQEPLKEGPRTLATDVNLKLDIPIKGNKGFYKIKASTCREDRSSE